MNGLKYRKRQKRRTELLFGNSKAAAKTLSYGAQVPRALACNLGLFALLLTAALWHFEPQKAAGAQQAQVEALSPPAPLVLSQLAPQASQP